MATTSTYRPPAAGGLTARQRWTHEHIVRCPCCGSWEVVDHVELVLRAAEISQPRTTCAHLATALAQQEYRAS